jgi:hypothetical protein
MVRPGTAIVAAGLAALPLWSCETTGGGRSARQPDSLTGLVLDPEGRAVPFAKVSVLPNAAYEDPEGRRKKEAEPLPDNARGLAVSNESGRWVIERLADDGGADLGLPRSWYYEVTVYKAGYHLWKDSVLYEAGQLQIAVTLYADTIDLEDVGNLVDTETGDTNTGTGVVRQGE